MGEGQPTFHIVADGSMGEASTDDDWSDRSTASRKIVLLDIENMMFGAHETDAVRNRSAEILALAEARRPTDMVIVGCNPSMAFRAKDLFPNAQIVTGRGKDGADAALIDMIDIRHAAERFNELVIVSGDHAFAPIAHAARKVGLSVRVVAPRHGLSTALRVFADTAVILPDDADEGDILAA